MQPVQRRLTSLLIIFFFLSGRAQQFYTCDNTLNIYKITVNPSTGCTATLVPKCTNYNPFSIAIYKDTLYSVDGNNLKRAQIVNGVVSACAFICQLPQAFVALTSDSTGMLYGAYSTALYKINPRTGITTLLGMMPFVSGGDLLFYKGSLYMAAISPTRGIAKLDIINPMLSTMYIPIPNSDIFGLVTTPVDCNTNKVYAMNRVGPNTQLMEMNMEQQVIVGIQCILPIQIYDAASSVETGQFTGVNLQSIVSNPQCSNRPPASGSLQINPVAGVSAYTYTLNNTVTNTTGLFSGLTPGTYPIHITAAGGCMLDTTATIYPADTPHLQTQVADAYCNNNNGSIISTASASLPPYLYNLNNGTSQASGTFNNLAAGSYLLQVTDSNHCISAANLTIRNLRPTLVQNITISPPVCNTNNGFVTVSAAGATGYSINNGTQQASGQFLNLAAGTYTVSTFTAQGCRYDSTVLLSMFYPDIVQNVTVIAAICNQNNGAITINAANATGYSINSGGQQPTGQFTNLASGTYLLSTFTLQGCRKDTTVNISNITYPPPAIGIASVAPDCYNRNNGKIMLTVNGPRTPYLISLGSGTFNSQTLFTDLKSGNFQIHVKDTGGCITDTTTTVLPFVISRPVYTVTTELPTCLEPQTGVIHFDVTGGFSTYTLRYQNGTYPADHYFRSLPAGNYSFYIENKNGCPIDSASVALAQIQSSECDTVYVPTAFTPNSDGKNDVFKAVAYGTLLQYQFFVYDRYGHLVFSSKEITQGWNGTRNGILQPTGAYIWHIIYQFQNGRSFNRKGTVMLIR